jgi:hypothetical protein
MTALHLLALIAAVITVLNVAVIAALLIHYRHETRNR